MGNASWSASEYATYSASVASKPREEVFARRGMDAALDPAKIKLRESVDSPANPKSTPIIIACDETGSMGALAEIIIKRGLGVVMKSLLAEVISTIIAINEGADANRVAEDFDDEARAIVHEATRKLLPAGA